jgi:hypothetical protein
MTNRKCLVILVFTVPGKPRRAAFSAHFRRPSGEIEVSLREGEIKHVLTEFPPVLDPVAE